jgi:hypothetical protein
MNDTRLWKEKSEKCETQRKLLLTDRDSVRVFGYREKYSVSDVTNAHELRFTFVSRALNMKTT